MAKTYQKKAVPQLPKITVAPVFLAQWEDLETIGDIRRFLRWTTLSLVTDRIDSKKAGALGNLGICMMKAIEIESFEKRMAAIEKHIAAAEHIADAEFTEPPVTH